jgi:glyceraldehyde 3-phosphate dehydrogenase
MATGIGTNGFRRIGRLTFRNAIERQGQESEIVGINDLTAPETNAHLLQWDGTYRKYPGNVESGKESFISLSDVVSYRRQLDLDLLKLAKLLAQ